MAIWRHESMATLASHFPTDALSTENWWPADRSDLIGVLTLGVDGTYTFSTEQRDLLSDDAPIGS